MKKNEKGKSSISLRAFLLLHGALLLYAVVTVLTKLASGYLSRADWPMTLLWLFCSMAALGAYSILWQHPLDLPVRRFVLRRKPDLRKGGGHPGGAAGRMAGGDGS